MSKNVSILLIVAFAVFQSINVSAQNNTLQHFIHYSAYEQNMWGPDSSYDIDIDYTFFDVDIDEQWGFTEITSIFGQQFGVGFVTGIETILASSYTATGFNTGSFDIDYPVLITLDFPIEDSFDYGGPATIHTWYEVQPGWQLETHFPPVGVTTLDLEYMINPYMDFIVCVFGCDTTHLIPASVQVPYHHDTLFHIDGNSDPNYVIYPCLDNNGEVTMCHEYSDTIFIPDYFDIGLTAAVSLPYVETEDYIESGTQCLIASGDSLYMDVELDILHFIHSMAGLIPPPEGPQIQQAIDFLNDTITFPYQTSMGNITAVIAYDLLSAYFNVYSYMHQEISFCPTIWAKLSFPVELPYEITDPNNGNALFEDGINDTIAVPVGHDLTITYPCHGTAPYEDSMCIGVAYDITPTVTNHTWDSIAFEITIEALTVSITVDLPFKKAIEPATLPGFELPELMAENNTGIYASAPPIQSPGVDVEGTEKNAAKNLGPWEIGPLFEWIIPIGNTDLTWFNETWEMENFIQDTAFPGTCIVPFDKSELNLNMYIEQGTFCYGDSLGHIYAQATDDLAPLTYYWSNGETHSGIMHSLDSLQAAPGYYSVTATNDYGCTTEDDYTVEINPPIIHSLEGEDILCHGMHTGTIAATTSGGTPPYSYEWYPGVNNNGLGHDTATNLSAGMHYVTISDWTGCSVVDSIYLNEPATALAADISSTPVDCHSDENGNITISPYNGTPPYSIDWEDPSLSGYAIENIAGGTYTVSITDANGCVLEEDIEVIQPDSLVTNIASTNITCYGDADGQIGIYPEGGTPPYSYRWFHDLTIDTDTLNNLPPGFYFASVTDDHGCVDTISAYITQPDTLDLIVNIQNTSCQGLYNGWISISPQGGTPPYTIEWEGHPEWYNVDSVHHLNAGIYPVSITDSHGCEYVEEIEVTEPDNLSVQFTDINNISCYGLEDGSVIADVSGGTAPYEYNWTNGINYDDSLAYDLIANEEYAVTITDAHDCQVQNYITLSQPDPLELENLTSEPVECGVSAGSGHAEADGGTEPYTFDWSNGETGPDPVDLPMGTVFVTVTDAHGCKDTNSIEIGITGNINAQADIIDEILCYGDSTARAYAALPDGFPPVTFVWYNEDDVIINEDDTASHLPAGTYHIFAQDVYFCSDTVQLIIEQPDSINAGLELISPSCSAVPDGKILTDVSGGTSPYNYAWSTGSYESEITDVRDGTYFLTITDYHDCTKELSIDLEEEEYCVIVHNTITPNGDGKNDTWVVENIEEFSYSEVWIYNRDGRELFNVQGYKNNWDGTYNGNDLPDGTYFYIIDLGKGKDLIKGHLTIIR
ncbi:MAG: gliding motility-associated C-terminal domain-containing protein [Bacteroidales bacterium]